MRKCDLVEYQTLVVSVGGTGKIQHIIQMISSWEYVISSRPVQV